MPHRLGKLVLFLSFSMLGACAVQSEGPGQPQPDFYAPIEPPGGGTQPTESCTPEVTGLLPTKQTSISMECPAGWKRRPPKTPISGRFTSYAHLVDALCVAIDENSDPRTTTEDLGIDFTKNDVYATPYDPATRAPAMSTRGASELWIRVQTSSCSGGTTSSFATALFVVPKEAEVVEQTCSFACAF